MATDIRTPVGNAPLVPVAIIAIGAYLAWFGIHYWGSDTKWPTDPVKAVLQGKAIPQPKGQASAASIAQGVEAQSPGTSAAGGGPGGGIQSGSSGTATGLNAGPSAPGNVNAAANQQTARMLAISGGHADWTTGQQWTDWVALWNRESGWDQTAYYPSTHTTNPDNSHAFGIPQALPADKMAQFGADWRTNPATQIRWGIWYIATTYGSPSGAWAHEVSQGWY